jgi:hypothetical protein
MPRNSTASKVSLITLKLCNGTFNVSAFTLKPPIISAGVIVETYTEQGNHHVLLIVELVAMPKYVRPSDIRDVSGGGREWHYPAD